MAPSFKRDLFAGVLTALGTGVNNVVNNTDTLLGSALSALGTESADILGAFLTDNVSTVMIPSIEHTC